MGSTTKDPELLEVPGAEGLSIDYLKDLMGYEAPKKDVPLLDVAGISGAERTTQDLLKKFLGTSATEGEAYQLGIGELKKTLGGEFYDPKTSDFWQGFRETSKMEQEEGVADIRRRGQIGGGLFSTGVAREETGYIARKGAERTTMLGGLFERERDRKTSAVGQALGYAGFEEAGKTSRLAAGSTIGALPRQIQQARHQATFNQANDQVNADYLSSILQTQVQTGAAEQLMPQWHVDEGSGESPLGGILGLIGTLAGIGK